MKRKAYVLSILCLLCIFATGCLTIKNQDADVDIQNTHENSAAATGKDTDKSKPREYPWADMNIDVDLTTLSSTMIYAEVNNIITNPEDYIGKTIRMSGPYYVSFYDITNLYYHYVIIEDATACCSQGLEFIWSGDHSYPDDYPKEQTKIEVVGVYGSYEELEITYYYLAVDDIFILE